MSIQRMDHVGVIVSDLTAAVAFFVDFGLELQGKMTMESELADRITAVDKAKSEVAMVRVPGDQGCLELIQYLTPESHAGDSHAPANTLGLRHLAFQVDDVEAVLDRVRPHGAELVGEVVNYENSFRLCYLRGPDGIIIELAEKLG
ncbi:VOC family protein [Amycolatopsis sp. BJA-103]|uniref:VOC family protein n=1 Tax=unclassified Amycolatopsis TaxID=2618356 RepID=UPI000C792AA0|nr:VOC family protein [Amycolatopsis sp. BJA-103]AUI57596.1 glyoxalase [Amycolatopsis sp. BJA-103]PNE13884.1 glyoxalase [Amycolatopsis sp. BJA-103]